MEDKSKLKIIKHLHYTYINNYIKNTLIKPTNLKMNNEWEIFDTKTCDTNSGYILNTNNDDILQLINYICESEIFTDYQIMYVIYIFDEICVLYAHLIDNYVYLFGTIYALSNKFYFGNFSPYDFLMKIFNIDDVKSKNMINCVDKFIRLHKITFSSSKKNKIINMIMI